MNEMTRYALTLSIICAVAAATLSGVNLLTKPRILAQAQAAEETALKDVLPQASRFEPVEKDGRVVYYKAFDADGNFTDVAFVAEQKGYSSVIRIMAGMSREGVIGSIKVLSQNETPGLGSGITSDEFGGQFSGKTIEGLSAVRAITGATVSSRAVIDSVKNKAGQIAELLKNE